MDLADLGFTDEYATYLKENNLGEFSAGRVTQEHRERYIVSNGEQDFEAEITGNMRYSASSRIDFPAVGDWVAMLTYDSDHAIIHRILPRKTLLKRKSVSGMAETQVIASNVDFAFIIQSVDNNFNINRLERYLTICYTAGIEPVLVLSKIDLSTDDTIRGAVEELGKREKKITFLLISNLTHEGLDNLTALILKGKTYCVIGSSGVGKSTLINNLLKKNIIRTNEISHSTNKGRHTTAHRELFVLDNGGIIIDTPGMKELGLTEDSEGIKTTFEGIFSLTLKCKFPDCTHSGEKGCAVVEALRNGDIDEDSVENFRKMIREQEHYNSTVAEKRRKDKSFGKMVKEILKEKGKNKF